MIKATLLSTAAVLTALTVVGLCGCGQETADTTTSSIEATTDATTSAMTVATTEATTFATVSTTDEKTTATDVAVTTEAQTVATTEATTVVYTQCTISVSGGTVSGYCDGKPVNGVTVGLFDIGSKITVTADDPDGTFIRWVDTTGAVVSEEKSFTLRITGGRTFIAEHSHEISEGLAFEVSADGSYAMVTGRGTWQGTVLNVPETYRGVPVIAIAANAFSADTRLTYVIGSGCLVQIFDKAFMNCRSLTDVRLSVNHEHIGKSAFEGCDSLVSVLTLENEDTTAYTEFEQTIKKAVMGKGKIVNERAFCNCTSLVGINVPQNVARIAYMAFAQCKSLRNITFPSTLTELGASAFSGCSSLTKLVVPTGIPEIADSTFSGCTSLSSLNLPEGIDRLGIRALADCSSLTTVALPYSLTTIDEAAFLSCTSLTQVYLRKNITSIATRAFEHCESLTAIAIPSGVKRIENYTFYCCYKMAHVTIPASVTYIGTNVFENCYGFATFSWPSQLTYINSGMFAGCKGLKTITIPKTVTEICDRAFAGSGLEEVTLPRGIVALDKNDKTKAEGTFANCTNLKTVNIPNTITDIGDSTFRGCTALELIVYSGTKGQWNGVVVKKGSDWATGASTFVLRCADGDIIVNG